MIGSTFAQYTKWMSLSGGVVLVLPAYKPSPELPALIESVLSAAGCPIGHVVVVDDGSGPAYTSVFDQVQRIPAVLLVRHAINLGKGAALKSGFNAALVTWPEAPGIVTADADGQHAPTDIVAVARALSESPDRLVMGARQFQEGVPPRSHFGNLLTRHVFAAATGVRVSDTQTGLRGWPRSQCLSALQIPLNGYDFELECLLAGGRGVQEVPIQTIYIDGNRASHFNPLRDSMRIYFVFLRYCGAALLAALVDSLVFCIAHQSGASISVSQVAGRTAAVIIVFFIAREMVFRSNAPPGVAAAKYLLLVIVMGFISYNMLLALTMRMGIPVLVSKLIAEGFLFLGNFAIQRDFIFVSPMSKAGVNVTMSDVGLKPDRLPPQ